MLSVVLPIIGILGLWLFSGQKVNADNPTSIKVGNAVLSSDKPYTVDGSSAAIDPGEGNRAYGYALFDAGSDTLTLHNYVSSKIYCIVSNDYSAYICYTDYDLLHIRLEGKNELNDTGSTVPMNFAGIYVEHSVSVEGPGTIVVHEKKCSDGYINYGFRSFDKDITINSGDMSFIGNDDYMGTMAYNIYINGGNINTSGNMMGIVLHESLCINGGKVDATGSVAAIIAEKGLTLGNKMLIKTPQGGTIELHDFGGEYIYTVMDGNTVALHAIISDHDENNGSGDGSGNSAGGAGKACNHDYQWTVEREPTITEDGEEVYKCTKCGDISARQPLSAAGFCFLDAEGKVRNAKAGQTLKLNFKQWNSVPKAFFEELAKRRDITVVIRFTYNHKTYEMTVTPDMAIDISHDYYGPEKLILLYGAKEVKG